MSKLKISLAWAIVLTGIPFLVFGKGAEKNMSAIPSLHIEKLSNGLTLLLIENHKVPLVRVEVAIRGGAVYQTKANAGLFHLYEHMLFKGNKAYPNQNAFDKAMNKMGVAQYNGGTGYERVNYFLTTSSSNLDEAVEFWSNAVFTPLFDENELQREKGVVINEISDYATPERVLGNGINHLFYPSETWRVDPAGSVPTIQSATRNQLVEIEKTFYSPHNMALIISGDITLNEAKSAAKKYFSSVKNERAIPKNSVVPTLTASKLAYYKSPRIADKQASVFTLLTGPSTETARHEAYVADLFFALLDEPAGRFKKDMFAAVPNQVSPLDISGGYFTMRDTPQIEIGTHFHYSGAQTPFTDSAAFKAALEKNFQTIAEDKNYFSSAEIQQAKQTIEDEQLELQSSPSSLAKAVSSYWAAGDEHFLPEYVASIKSVTAQELQGFAQKYLASSPSLTVLQVSSSAQLSDAAQSSFQEITSKNAFWWRS